MSDNCRFCTAVVLAAGEGVRMKSDRPKVLCEVLFKPMVRWVADACQKAGIENLAVVVGEQAGEIEAALPKGCRYFLQEERRGTGHAVMAAGEALRGDGDVLVLYGDTPLVPPELINAAYAFHKEHQNALTLVSTRAERPTGYGRILRDAAGTLMKVVEERDADEKIREIREINSGIYWFDAAFLRQALQKLTCDNAQREYYLTDTIQIAAAQGARLGAFLWENEEDVRGCNDRRQLMELGRIARDRILQSHLLDGVDIPLSDGILIGPDVTIGHDARILPGSILLGETRIGPHAVIGPNSRLENAVVGAYTRVAASYLTDAQVGERSTVGPFSQLRPGTRLGDRVKVGDFVEFKNATIGDGTSVAHLTYLGDCDVGQNCNFGCGVVTANYDGVKKYRSAIGDRVFIGCNTNLISPVRIGDGAYTAAGTTVDGDVPAGALSVGRVRQQIKEGWADKHIRFKAGPPKKG